MPEDSTIPVEVDEDASYRRLLRGVLWTLVLVSVLSFVGIFSSDNFTAPRGVFLPLSLGVAAASFWQLKRSVQRGAAILIVGVWLVTTAITVIYSGVHSASMLVYAFLIVLAGWIKGQRWLVWVTGLTIALVLGLGLLEGVGLYHPVARPSAVYVTLTLASVLFALGILTAVGYGSLKQARDRSMTLLQESAQNNLMMAQRERDLQMILDHVPAGVASFDAQSNLRFSNLHYAAMFGAEPEELVGKNIAAYLSKESLEDVRLPWQQCLAGKTASYRRVNRNRRTGEARILDVQLEPEYDQGRVMGMFALLIDVTDKVASEDQIRELNETLERRVERRTAELGDALDKLQNSQEELARSETKAALSTLIASVSHELSTPLGNSLMSATTLTGLSAGFQSLLDSNQIKRSDLSNFVASVHTGTDLLHRNLQRAQDLLSKFRQVANDQASEQRRVFDLAITVREVVDTLAPSLKRHPHRIVLDIADGISMDSLPGPLGQVVINLINNAYLHAFEGRTDGVLTISGKPMGEDVALSFSDNGVGISPDILARLFEPFFSTKKGRGGTGLGMGIVETLVQKVLGGTIQVHSEPGVGTRIDLLLPLVAPQKSADA